MKFKLEVLLQKPRAQVWNTFINPDLLKQWQPALEKIELLSGTAGQPGAASRLTYRGKSEFSLVEKIIQRVDPERLDQLYENEFADNLVKNTFFEQGQETTLWKVEVEFKFKTLLMHLLGPFAKKRFVANTQRDMDRFKALVEGQ